MALHDLLYRCPLCGTDPTEPGGGPDEVRCPTCGARMTWQPEPPAGSEGEAGRVDVETPGGEGSGSVPIHLLTQRIAAMGGPIPAALGEGGVLGASAEIRLRWVEREAAVRYRKSVLGFRELLGRAGEAARLELDGSVLQVWPVSKEGGEGSGGRPRHRWHVGDIRALQAMTSALQLSLADGSVVLLAFEEASARRWDDLLRAAMQRVRAREGEDVISEFQPRVRGR
ncbi:MAG: hypothetical protein EA352_12195 [Gemmatimonadales bacterium]|nr:MAG: hypothetical protein EA352_12195 [Gemmatimonadales bacterium]